MTQLYKTVPSRLFRSAAEYYARYRPPYSDELIKRIVGFCSETPQVACDLGCGTGGIAIPLSRQVGKIYAIDPEPEMIQKAKQAASDSKRENIVFIEARAENLPEDIPSFHLVTMGQCFHWMDRGKVLGILSQKLDSCGCVVVITGNPLGLIFEEQEKQPEWLQVLPNVLSHWCGQSRWADPPGWKSHETIATECGWTVETSFFQETFERNIDEVVGLCLSLSFCSPERLGKKQAAFEADVRERLLAVQPNNHFIERSSRQLLVLRQG